MYYVTGKGFTLNENFGAVNFFMPARQVVMRFDRVVATDGDCSGQ
jgi:hypothetical protein